MSGQHAKYELLKEETNTRHKHVYIQVCLLVAVCAMSSIAVFVTWTVIYRKHIIIPPKVTDTPDWWAKRALLYAHYIYNTPTNHSTQIPVHRHSAARFAVKQIENERIYPSKYGNFIYTPLEPDQSAPKLVCYYHIPQIHATDLPPNRIDPNLCTHLNVGIIDIKHNELQLDRSLQPVFDQINELKKRNRQLKVLLWVGGGDADSVGFSEMIRNHANRKQFIQSLKSALETYRLDGIDLDWEFPSAYNRERQHFSQLLHEIRREYQREHRTYLLSVAVAAPEGIAYFAYDIAELNSYADYVNVMTYDYHFYSKASPFTGLNAPLYQRDNENGVMSMLNINASVTYWHTHGMDKSKIVIGLPTYGHSFRLVNAFNIKLGSPASGFGSVGSLGFVTYSDICWFKQNNYFITTVFDAETCSPYLVAGTEWISYDDEQSMECKTNFIKSNGYGGAMIFSLNTDDYSSTCDTTATRFSASNGEAEVKQFPLVRKINAVLFDNN